MSHNQHMCARWSRAAAQRSRCMSSVAIRMCITRSCNGRCFTLTMVAVLHCVTLQYTASHCNTLQHTATLCNTLHRTASHCTTLPCTATRCNTLHHTATQYTLSSDSSDCISRDLLCFPRKLHAVCRDSASVFAFWM